MSSDAEKATISKMTDEYNQEDERSFDETIDDAFDEDEAANAALERAFANLPTDEKKKNAGQPGHKLQKKWDEMYRRLLIFREKHGHCLVPNRYVDDPQLGSWGMYFFLNYWKDR